MIMERTGSFLLVRVRSTIVTRGGMAKLSGHVTMTIVVMAADFAQVSQIFQIVRVKPSDRSSLSL